MVRHRDIPASLHCSRPTTSVDWTGLGIAPVRDHRAWPYSGAAIAGVNTYGLSGTFVHIVVGEPGSSAGAGGQSVGQFEHLPA